MTSPPTPSSPPRRVAVVGPMPPYRGGIAHFTQGTLRGLAAAGYETLPVSFKRQYPERLFPGTSQYEPAAQQAGADAGADADAAPRLIDTVNPASWRRAGRYLAEQAPETVLFQYWMPLMAPAYAGIARRLRKDGVQVLALVHNALSHERRPGEAFVARRFLRACDGLLVLSDAVAADLERLGVDVPVRRAAHPVYDQFGAPVPRAEARAALGLPGDAPVLLFFGFVRRYKGLHVLLEALPDVVAAHPDAQLLVAGEFYEDAAPYHARVEALGLGAHVRFVDGYIPSEDVPRYFSAADAVVQPYVSATQSGVVQIAYHFERPVVVTDVGGLAEVVPDGEAGLVVPPGDAPALAAALVRFFTDDLAGPLAEGVRREKQRHGWDQLVDTLTTLIDTA